MSSADDLLEKMRNYQSVRNKLRYPPNAVVDSPIDLTRKSTAYKGDIPPPNTPSKKPLADPKPVKTYKEIPFPIQFDDILGAVSDFYELSPNILKGDGRCRKEVVARRVVVHLTQKLIPARSLSSIGRDLCKDHTSMVHARQRITQDLVGDEGLRRNILMIEESIVAKHRAKLESAATLPSESTSSMLPSEDCFL